MRRDPTMGPQRPQRLSKGQHTVIGGLVCGGAALVSLGSLWWVGPLLIVALLAAGGLGKWAMRGTVSRSERERILDEAAPWAALDDCPPSWEDPHNALFWELHPEGVGERSDGHQHPAAGLANARRKAANEARTVDEFRKAAQDKLMILSEGMRMQTLPARTLRKGMRVTDGVEYTTWTGPREDRARHSGGWTEIEQAGELYNPDLEWLGVVG